MKTIEVEKLDGFVRHTFRGKLANVVGERDELGFEGKYLSLIEEFDVFNKQVVSVRFWLSDQEVTDNEAVLATIAEVFGTVDQLYGVLYTEITGYIGTTERFIVGGHNVVSILRENVGKYLILQVDVHTKHNK